MRINCILLAAGKSSRFNGNKLLEKFNNKPLVSHIIEKVIKLKFNNVIMVTNNIEIERIAKENNVTIVRNPNPEYGQSHSLHLGMNIDGNCDAYMFFVCDQPMLSIETIRQMVELYETSNKGIVCASYESKFGNPVIFSAKYKEALLRISGDVGGRIIIQSNLDDVVTYEVWDEVELLDIDSVNDLEYLKRVF